MTYLKIKDNIGIEDLRQYGIQKLSNHYQQPCYTVYCEDGNHVQINEKDKIIEVIGTLPAKTGLSKVYDLINAGFVVKVELVEKVVD